MPVPYLTRRKIHLCLALTVVSLQLFAQAPPALPDMAGFSTCLPDTSGYVVRTVGPSGRDYSDLQTAINQAQPGSILLLDAGVRFSGSFTLPNKTGAGWIILASSQWALLPAPGIRIDPLAPTGNSQYPTQAAAMPKIVTTNPAGLPCFRTHAAAHQYRLVGLEITADTTVLNSYGLVFFGDASAAQNTVAKVPHDLILDRCYVHGHTQATVMKAGVLLNAARAAVLDSYVSDFHSIGFDTYAIGGTNGPGPFRIRNNYLEAAGENILFGGAAPAIPGLVPADLEICNNHFFKPFSWRVGHPDYAGRHWTIKNLFELKTGKRVLLEGNVLENVWADLPIGQSGYAILLTVRNEGSAAPQADVSDVTIRNNIIRHAGAGMTLSGHDSPGPSQPSQRIWISNNLFEDISGPDYGDGNIYGPNDGTFLKIGDPTDVLIDHNTVLQSGPLTWAYDTVQRIALTNNLVHCFLSDGGYQGLYGPGFAQGGNGPMGAYFPGITDANRLFHKNVLIGGNPARYSNYNGLSQNYFPADVAAVQFVDYANGSTDYHGYALAATSTYKNAASDGGAIGVQLARLDSALALPPECLPVVAVHNGAPEPAVRVFPNPARDWVSVQSPADLKAAEFLLLDLLGRERRRWPAQQGQLPVRDLPRGLYHWLWLEAGQPRAGGRLLLVGD
ncbi:MAG: hypothetical protein IT260_16440 [Saprospiraceae bacterium]|nr:hypothetical protein [Saprospiraceae bacterium]